MNLFLADFSNLKPLCEAAAEAAAPEVTTAPASILLLSQVSGLYPRLREPK